eukprot:4591064-Amphidinium_carterae.1
MQLSALNSLQVPDIYSAGTQLQTQSNYNCARILALKQHHRHGCSSPCRLSTTSQKWLEPYEPRRESCEHHIAE